MTYLSAPRVLVVLLCMAGIGAVGQDTQAPHPPDYRGVQTHVPGVFVTPIPDAPFSGTVEILSKEILLDGSTYTRHTINHIARNSAGVIHNERRRLVSPQFKGEPRLVAIHIYDPSTRLNTFLDPATHIARQNVFRGQPHPPVNGTPPTPDEVQKSQGITVQDLGTTTIAGIPLRGTRKTRVVPALSSGTGQDVTITDDYWYSEELKVYLVLKHSDPRTGEQTVGITQIERSEPDPSLFVIPSTYKVVDETPVE
jgi:hypothetical protein